MRRDAESRVVFQHRDSIQAVAPFVHIGDDVLLARYFWWRVGITVWHECPLIAINPFALHSQTARQKHAKPHRRFVNVAAQKLQEAGNS